MAQRDGSRIACRNRLRCAGERGHAQMEALRRLWQWSRPMGITIGLGLQNFLGDEPGLREQALEDIVRSSSTMALREIVDAGPDCDLSRARVFEVVRTFDQHLVADYLSPELATSILSAVAATWDKYDSWASFAYEEAEDLGIWCQDIAFLNPGPIASVRLHRQRPRSAAPELELKLMDATETLPIFQAVDHPQATIAVALNELALRYSLVLSTG
jgi:hypothetical protein